MKENTKKDTRDRREYRKQFYEKHKERIKADRIERKKIASLRGKTYIQNYLKSHPCIDCGESNTVILEFDHVRGKKRSALFAMHHYSIKSIQEEIDKCDVRCVNCHRIATCNRRVAPTISKIKRIKNAKEYVRNYLNTRFCIDCGEDNAIVLDFDHVRGEKVSDISRMKENGLKINKIQQEINKCDIRCANCHRKVTDKRIREGTHKDRISKINNL